MKKIDDYTKLINYIKEIYIKNDWNVSDIPMSKIGTQIKKLMNDNSEYLYSAIQYTLWYMVEMEEMNILNDDSDSFIPLIPYYYDQAKAFNIKCKEVKKSVENFDFTDEVIEIKINPNRINERRVKEEVLTFEDYDKKAPQEFYDWKVELDKYRRNLNKDKEPEIINDYEELTFE